MKAEGGSDEVTLAILAGGKGTRLGGVAKGLIEVDGRPILQRLLEALRPCVREVLLVTDDASPYARFAVRAVPDEEKGRGAPGGLHAALAHARTRWVLLVACDMPFVSARAVELLSAARAGDPSAQWVCFERDGRLEPMPGLYSRALARPLAEALPGNPSFQKVLRSLPGVAVPVAALRAHEPDDASLQSVNTPEDLARVHGVAPKVRSEPSG